MVSNRVMIISDGGFYVMLVYYTL